jgi:hypothetical protein
MVLRAQPEEAETSEVPEPEGVNFSQFYEISSAFPHFSEGD